MNYKLDIYRRDDDWVAIVPELLAAGKGRTAGDAVEAALARATETEHHLTEAGISDRAGTPPARQPFMKILRETIVGFGLRAVIVGVVVLLVLSPGVWTVMQFAHQAKSEILAEVGSIRQAIDDPGGPSAATKSERLRARAQRLRNLLMPAAEELRPVVRALIGPASADGGTGQ